MNSIIARLLISLLTVTAFNYAVAASPVPNHELDGVLRRLATTATEEQYNQIVGGIKASASLMTDLNGLAASGELTDINVVLPGMAPKARGVAFGGSVDGTKIFFTTDFLKELLKNRIFDVVHADDIYPNNFTFAIGHLAYHLKTSKEMDNLDADFKRQVGELSSSPGGHDFTSILQSKMRKRIENEASAFIQAWNDTVEAATRSNGDSPLNAQQVSTLMMNLRYRFAFLKALRLPENSLLLTPAGLVELNDRNVKAISTALSTSSIADIQ